MVLRELLPSEVIPDAAEVKAMIPGKAFLQFRNALVSVQVGDRVKGGYVSGINPSQSKVEFTMDEGGVIRKVEKTIHFDKRN